MCMAPGGSGTSSQSSIRAIWSPLELPRMLNAVIARQPASLFRSEQIMTNRNWVVGVFVVAGLALLTIGLFMVGDRHQAFAKHMKYYAEFKDLDGLSQGAKVRVGGMDAGEVLAIEIPNSPAMRFRVELRIDEK